MHCAVVATVAGLCVADLPWVNVFTAGEAGVPQYRIPAIVQTGKGTLIAFAEARMQPASDCGYKWIVAKRSLDGGATWGPLISVVGQNATRNSTGNPAATWDAVTGRVVLGFCTSPTGSCNPSTLTLTVDDGGSDGVAWGTPTIVPLGQWSGTLPGPGNGAVVLSSPSSPAPRRLVFASHFGAYADDVVYYSDDGGATFAVSQTVLPKMDEVAVAELWNGSLMLNMRNDHVNSCQCRGVSLSHDGGATWSPVAFDATLIEPVCQAALVSLNDALYFSNPASTSVRANITIRRTDARDTAWRNASLRVATGPQFGGYTALVPAPLAVNASAGGILYERTDTSLPPAQQDAIAFSVFPLDF